MKDTGRVALSFWVNGTAVPPWVCIKVNARNKTGAAGVEEATELGNSDFMSMRTVYG